MSPGKISDSKADGSEFFREQAANSIIAGFAVMKTASHSAVNPTVDVCADATAAAVAPIFLLGGISTATTGACVHEVFDQTLKDNQKIHDGIDKSCNVMEKGSLKSTDMCIKHSNSLYGYLLTWLNWSSVK